MANNKPVRKAKKAASVARVPLATAALPSCHITGAATGAPQISRSDMPVNLKLCENRSGDPATSTHFFKVSVFLHNTTTPGAAQPTGLTNTTVTLQPLPAGQYDVAITVLHLPNAVAFVYEACDHPDLTNQLCDIDTSNGPATNFALTVT
jgi:hypothetical protein